MTTAYALSTLDEAALVVEVARRNLALRRGELHRAQRAMAEALNVAFRVRTDTQHAVEIMEEALRELARVKDGGGT